MGSYLVLYLKIQFGFSGFLLHTSPKSCAFLCYFSFRALVNGRYRYVEHLANWAIIIRFLASSLDVGNCVIQVSSVPAITWICFFD